MHGRPGEVTRLEGFSDAVFGFALTLLVVSLEVPGSFTQLAQQMRGFVGFALMFAMVCWIWYEHSVYFRRFGRPDPWTVFLNSLLLFVVLFYVYPLKFLTQALMHTLGWGTPEGPRFTGDTDGVLLMVLYSAGVVLIFGVFLLLYRHAWKGRGELDLDESGVIALQYGMRSHAISMGLGVTSLAMLAVAPAWLAGVLYGLMGPLHAWNGYRAGAAQSKLAARTGATVDRAASGSAGAER
jgi:uncharacterized membrane protein